MLLDFLSALFDSSGLFAYIILRVLYPCVEEKERVMRSLGCCMLGMLVTFGVSAQQTGIPASDTLGADDLAGNPTFIGGVANGGGTVHGVW